jgi:hypothetical protein
MSSFVASVECNLVRLYSQRGDRRRPRASVKFEMDAARLREVAGTGEQ